MEAFTREYLNDLIESITSDFKQLIIQKQNEIPKISLEDFEQWKVQNRFNNNIQQALCNYMGLETYNECLGIIKMETEHNFVNKDTKN